MDTSRKFKGAMFGYSKKDVNAYIMDAAREYDKKDRMLTEENQKLKEEAAALRGKANAMGHKLEALERERNYIADALLDAKQEAQKIVADAKMEAARLRSALEVELEKLRAEIRSEQENLSDIRKDAKDALEAYIGRLSDIDMKIEAAADVSGYDASEEAEADYAEEDIEAGEKMDEEEDIYIPDRAAEDEEEDEYEPEAEEEDEEEEDFAFRIEDIEA